MGESVRLGGEGGMWCRGSGGIGRGSEGGGWMGGRGGLLRGGRRMRKM